MTILSRSLFIKIMKKCKWAAFIQCFFNQWPLKVLHSIASHLPIHAHTHTPTAVSATQKATQPARRELLVYGVSLRDTEPGRAGDRTSNLPVTSQPTLPPEQGHFRDSFSLEKPSQHQRSLQMQVAAVLVFALFQR